MFKALWIAVLLGLALTSPCAFAAPAPASPEAVTVEFYKWYVHENVKDRFPLEDDPATLAKYATLPLIQQIKKRQSSDDPPDSDYFTGCQDYMDDWEANISVAPKHAAPGRASMVVTLGKRADTIEILAVDLVLDHGTWKISKVKALN